MSWVARYRKMIAAALGFAVTLVLLIPADQVPEQWRPWVGLLLAVATVAGVRQVKNAPPPTGMIENVRRPTTYRPVRRPGDPLE
jgi:hypothetical protein